MSLKPYAIRTAFVVSLLLVCLVTVLYPKYSINWYSYLTYKNQTMDQNYQSQNTYPVVEETSMEEAINMNTTDILTGTDESQTPNAKDENTTAKEVKKINTADENRAMNNTHKNESHNLNSTMFTGENITPTPMPALDGINVIAMSLYGSNTRYTEGALKNAELVKQNFPGWKLRIYTLTPTNSSSMTVPQQVVSNLTNMGVEMHYINPVNNKIPPMMWRFLVADDMKVDRFIVRDSDSRLTPRDAAAVYEWVKSNKAFNCIRDHPSHAGYAISGGMWGAKPKELHDILGISWEKEMMGKGAGYLTDMNFLNHFIWPKVKDHAYCSDSVSCTKFPGAHPFPVVRHDYEHVGQVYINNVGRNGDIQILKNSGENQNCTPKSQVKTR